MTRDIGKPTLMTVAMPESLGSLQLVARHTEMFMKKMLILLKIHQPLNTK